MFFNTDGVYHLLAWAEDVYRNGENTLTRTAQSGGVEYVRVSPAAEKRITVDNWSAYLQSVEIYPDLDGNSLFAESEKAYAATSPEQLDIVMHLHYYYFSYPSTQEAAMSAILEVQSTLTDRYQTTVPAGVRKALKLGKGAKVRYALMDDGTVILSAAPLKEKDDPVLGRFLEFVAKDIESHPEKIQAFSVARLKKLRTLIHGVKFDLDQPLPPDQE